MKKNILIVICLISSYYSNAQNLPSKKTIISKIVLVNNYLNQKYKFQLKNDFNTAIYFDGLFASDPKATLKIKKWAKNRNYSLPANDSTQNAEDIAIGSIYLDLYKMDTTQKSILIPVKNRADSISNNYKLDDWTRLEALYSIMPVLAKMAIITNQELYHDKLFQIFSYTKNIEGLYSEQEFLWFRDKNYKAPYKTPNGQNCFWARGNGLLAAGLVKTLSILPKEAPHYQEYMDSYLELMIATMNLQRPDGYWNSSLTDNKHFGGKELTGTALITYAMAWGLSHDIIDKTTFTPIVTKAINGMIKESVAPNGFLMWAQGEGKEPGDNQPVSKQKAPKNEFQGAGCFLLAASEVAKIAK